MTRSLKPTADIFVDRNTILSFFHPPPATSTFYDWVNAGRVVQAPVKGFFKLNATLLHLGLPEVNVAEFQKQHRHEDIDRERAILFTALSVLVKETMLCPADEFLDVLSNEELSKVRRHCKAHVQALNGGDESILSDEPGRGRIPITEPLARLAYVGGVLDAYDLQRRGRIRGHK